MKKIFIILAMTIGTATCAMAQENYNGNCGLFGKGSWSDGIFTDRGLVDEELEFPEHGSETDGGAPLGSGTAVLVGLGAAYLVGKKHKEE